MFAPERADAPLACIRRDCTRRGWSPGCVHLDGGDCARTFWAVPRSNVLTTRRPLLLMQDLCVRYPRCEGLALREVNLRVEAGEFVSVVGASGSGKTTLVRTALGELRPSRGQLVVARMEATHLPRFRLPALRRRIGVTFQDARLLPGRTALDNIVYALELVGSSRKAARRAAAQSLEVVGVGHLADRRPEQLSGGEAQRVGIARALAGDPEILFADEPTGNLDPDSAAGVVDTLAAIADTGRAVVMVTHDVASVDRLGRRVVHVGQGRIVSDSADATYPADVNA